MRSASGDKRGGAGAGGRGGSVTLEAAAGGLVLVVARDFNGDSCRRENVRDCECFAIIMSAGKSIKKCLQYRTGRH